ncbi:MAG: bacterio-opsin activator domain-containing protein, partial [Halobacteriaceae archaeon]
MSVIADFTVPVDRFALKDTLPEVPTVKVEFERVVSHSQKWVLPFLWVYGDDLQTFDERTRRDSTVVSATVTDEFSNARLYDIQWSARIKAIINSIFDRDGTLVEASGSADSWDISVR